MLFLLMPQMLSLRLVKIVAVLPRFPYPLDKGDKLRAYHLLRQLSRRHQIYIFALTDSSLSAEDYKAVEQFAAAVEVFRLPRRRILFRLFGNVFSRLPFQTAYHTDSRALRRFRAFVKIHNPDAVFCQLIRTGEFAKGITCKRVLDFQDALSENMRLRIGRKNPFLRLLFRMEYKRLLAYECEMPNRFRSLCIISEKDRQALPESVRAQTRIVGNGVDIQFYKPLQVQTKTIDLLFVGAMSYRPNIEAAIFLVKQVMPLLKQKGLNLNISIVGADPVAEVKALTSEKVTVTGRVEDTRPYYASARLMVAPMFISTGVQNKILEAAAMLLPVVTTPQAAEAVGNPGKKCFAEASTADEFAEKIAYLLQNSDISSAYSRHAYAYVQQHFSWEFCARQLENCLQA
jgi:sugar transferase (PEP-CTERM/EpsH1 system associated)